MFELFSTSNRSRWNIHVHYSKYTGEWNIEGKSYDKGNIKAQTPTAPSASAATRSLRRR